MKYLFSLIWVICFSVSYAQDSTVYNASEIIYGRKDGMALTMIKLSPKQNSNGKALVSLVSGNWVSNYNMVAGFTRRSVNFVRSGYTVFLIMHGSQPRYAINDETEDIKKAVRFIRFNAKEYGIDPLHIGITGSSSGGHLALMTALTDDKINANAKEPADRVSARVQAAAVFFPPTDFLNWGTGNTTTDKTIRRRFGVAGAFDFKELSDSTGLYEHITGDEANLKIGREMSPIYNVSSDDPPVFIVHGDADPIVPLQQSLSLIKKLKEAGVINDLYIKKGGGHGWRNAEEEEKKFIAWFDKYLK